MKRIAVYPGTFDPVTNGHLDLAERGRKHVDQLIFAILSKGIADRHPGLGVAAMLPGLLL